MTIVQLDDCSIELTQPLKDRPDVVVIAASDGRRTILGDGQYPFSVDEYRKLMNKQERRCQAE